MKPSFSPVNPSNEAFPLFLFYEMTTELQMYYYAISHYAIGDPKLHSSPAPFWAKGPLYRSPLSAPTDLERLKDGNIHVFLFPFWL